MSNAADSVIRHGAKQYGHEYDLNRPLDLAATELERKLGEVIVDRHCIEQRMLDDLMQYVGVEDKPSLEISGKPKDKDSARAKVFIKLTRTKTNAGIAQLVDLLFPNDDKNWGIKPTPNPAMADMLEDGDSPAQINGTTYQYDDGKPVTKADIAKRAEERAADKAEKMEKLINDQLIETRYNSVCRSMLWDAGVVGTGIIKGPVVARDRKRAFIKLDTGEHALVVKEEFKPGTEWVRPWDFYPDMSASEIDECEFVFERRYMSRKQIRRLVGRKGFPQEQITKVLQMTPAQTQHRSTFQDDIRRVAGLTDTLNDTRYETWEYHGPIAEQVLADMGVMPQEEVTDSERDAVIFYCGGIVMGARLSMMDYERGFPYRVFNWERDHGSLFGYGVPSIIRDEQATLNTVWRQILDNGAASAGPQIGVRKGMVTPQDGSWAFSPFKVWDIADDMQISDIRQAFSTFDVPSNLQELSMILDRSRVFIDEVSGVPMLQQGEQGQATPTLGGMSMLMNAANTVRRAQVKMWDDDITTPLIADFYAFNMVNAEDDGVKGDFSVDARGTSSLLIKEQVGQAMTNFIAAAGSSPVFAPVLALKAPQLLSEWAKTQQIPTSCIPTEDELIKWQQEQQDAAAQGGPQDPALQVEQLRAEQAKAKMQHETELEQFRAQQRSQEIAADYQLKQMQMGAELQKQERQERIEMMKLAQSGELKGQELATNLKQANERNALEWDKFMTEIRVKQQAGMNANFGLE